MSTLTASSAKDCRVCGASFRPMNTLAIVCSIACARRVPIVQRRKDRERLEELKPRGHWLKQAQVAFNAWVRERDAALPCISCGRAHEGAWDAGHYLTTGARPELRFDEQNVHRQCVPCNQHLHGNLVLYRVGLLARIGRQGVERLEGHHPPAKLSIEALKAITADYRGRLAAMKRARA